MFEDDVLQRGGRHLLDAGVVGKAGDEDGQLLGGLRGFVVDHGLYLVGREVVVVVDRHPKCYAHPCRDEAEGVAAVVAMGDYVDVNSLLNVAVNGKEDTHAVVRGAHVGVLPPYRVERQYIPAAVADALDGIVEG